MSVSMSSSTGSEHKKKNNRTIIKIDCNKSYVTKTCSYDKSIEIFAWLFSLEELKTFPIKEALYTVTLWIVSITALVLWKQH